MCSLQREVKPPEAMHCMSGDFAITVTGTRIRLRRAQRPILRIPFISVWPKRFNPRRKTLMRLSILPVCSTRNRISTRQPCSTVKQFLICGILHSKACMPIRDLKACTPIYSRLMHRFCIRLSILWSTCGRFFPGRTTILPVIQAVLPVTLWLPSLPERMNLPRLEPQ